jgi:hypothetical protein
MVKATYDPAGKNAQLAADSAVVHNTGTETIAGAKTFSTSVNTPTINAPTGRAATYVIAASNATTLEQSQADYVCTGTSDDVAIQAAITAINSAGQGNIYLTSGTFNISATITLPTVPFTIKGASMGATKLYLVNGTNANMFSYTATGNVLFGLMADMTLIGKSTNYSGGTNTSGTAIYINNPSGQFWDIMFKDLFITYFATQGFFVAHPHDIVFDHVIVEYCGLASAGSVAAVEFDYGDCNYFVNCLFKLNYGRGVFIEAIDSTFVNCKFIQNATCGVYVGTTNIVFSACEFSQNSYGNTGNNPDMILAANNTTISGCTFDNYGGTSTAISNIQIWGGYGNHVITGSSFSGTTSIPIDDGGSGGNTFVGNQGVNSKLTNPTTAQITGASASGVPLTVTNDSATSNNGPALVVQDGTTYAHSGNIAQFKMLNGSDTGAVVRIENSGTGKNISSANGTTETFSVDKTGTVVLGNMTLSTVTGGGKIQGSAGGAFNVTDQVYANNVNVSAPTSAAGSVATVDGTQTLTNKRITKRVITATSTATPTPAGDTTDIYYLSTLTVGATFAAPTGTPTDGQELTIRVKSVAAQTLAWNAIYLASGVAALPTTSVAGKTITAKFVYDAAQVKWVCMAVDATGY